MAARPIVMQQESKRPVREAVNRGHAERPVTNEEVLVKFMENATLHFSATHAELIRDQILGLDRVAHIGALESLLAKDPSA